MSVPTKLEKMAAPPLLNAMVNDTQACWPLYLKRFDMGHFCSLEVNGEQKAD